MVKKIISSKLFRQAKEKRVRGKKSKAQIGKKKSAKKSKNMRKKLEKESFNKDYFLEERINFLSMQEPTFINKLLEREKNEFNEKNQDNSRPKYKQENRVLTLIGLKDIITQIREQNPHLKIQDKFIFSVMALFDFYLEKSERELKRVDMIKALYSCLGIIDKLENIRVFSDPYFEKYKGCDSETEIIETVDLNFYPVKLFDYFDAFYFKIKQIKKNDKKFLEYFEQFKKIFLDFAFYLVFHEHSLKLRPSTNFVSCLLLTYDRSQNILPKSQNFNELNDFIKQFEYSKEELLNANIMAEESIFVYNKMLQNIHEKSQINHKE